MLLLLLVILCILSGLVLIILLALLLLRGKEACSAEPSRYLQNLPHLRVRHRHTSSLIILAKPIFRLP